MVEFSGCTLSESFGAEIKRRTLDKTAGIYFLLTERALHCTVWA
jgi:hypothetical protein